MTFSEINAPKGHNDAADEQRAQHEVKTRISSGDKADKGTSTVTFPDAKRNVSVEMGFTSTLRSSTVTILQGLGIRANVTFFDHALMEADCTPVTRRISAKVTPA